MVDKKRPGEEKAGDQDDNLPAGPDSGIPAQNNPAILQALVDNMQQGILFEGSDRRILFANQWFCDIFGISSPGVILGAGCASLAEQAKHAFADPEGFIRTVERRVAERRTVLSEELSLGDGRTLERDYIPVLIGNRQAGNYWIYRDVTARKRAEDLLRKRETELNESQRLAHIGSWDWDAVTDAIWWSDEFYRIYCIDPRKPTPRYAEHLHVYSPDSAARLNAAVKQAMETGEPYELDLELAQPTASSRWILARGEVKRDASGKIRGLRGTAQNITESKTAEEKIRQSERFIRSILNTVDEGFLVVDRDYRILTANNAFCSQVSLSGDEVIGKHCFAVSHKKKRHCSEEGEECGPRQAFATGKPHAVLHKHTDQDGHLLYVETKAFPLKDEAGYVTSVIETINNITEKHLLEEERLKTQKLESIGTLAGGIAHDFNNLLQGIFGYISLAKMELDQKEKAVAMLEEAENALQRSVNLTTQLLTFSKGGNPVKKPVDLRAVIENAAKFTLSGSRSDFRMDIPEELWQTEADECQMAQVIQNIVLNADQAMPLGGSVIAAAKNLAEGDGSLPPGLARGNYIMISIRDTGAGIPEHDIGKIFDPYFTTREKGNGLGLATSYSIVRSHGGVIDVRTRPGDGSTFMIYLPASIGELRTAPGAKPAAPTPQRKARVLLMDDEELLRNMSRRLLRKFGHETEVAKHGEEALELYQRAMAAGKPFDIVILDLTVKGGMGGAETLRNLLKIAPAVKAIVSSGYSDDAVIADPLAHGFKAYLKKPYSVRVLSDLLTSLMNN